MSPSLRWGFLGAGFVATKGMAPALHQASNAVLQVVGSQDLERAAALMGHRSVVGYEAVLASDEVDAVYISLSNEQHRPWVERAAAAGKHVLCEKPLSVSAADTQAMLAAGSDHGVEVIEALWGRWHPRFAVLRDGFATGRWGRPMSIEAGFTFGGVPADNYRLDPQRGGGAWWDVGVYPMDLLLALHPPGEESVDVVINDVSRRLGPTGVDLETIVDLGVGDTRAHITTSIDGPEGQWLRILTDQGELSITSGQPFTSWQAETNLVFTRKGADPEAIEFTAIDPYVAMLQDVSRQLLGMDASDVIPTPPQMLRLSGAMDAVAGAPAR